MGKRAVHYDRDVEGNGECITGFQIQSGKLMEDFFVVISVCRTRVSIGMKEERMLLIQTCSMS